MERYLAARALRSAAGMPMISRGSSTLRNTLRHAYSAGAWKTYPYARLRRACSALTPLTVTRPAVGVARSAMTRISVVLPHPEGPMKDTNSPRRICRSMLSSAVTGASVV